MCKQRAFSLVELLVVLAIVSVLVAILAPALRDAREMARRAACGGGLRQHGLAMSMYTEHNDLRYPYNAVCWAQAPEDWIHWQVGRDVRGSAIAGYIGGYNADVFRCPSDDVNVRPRVLTEAFRHSYTMNGPFSSNGGWKPVGSSEVRRPLGKILLVEEDGRSLDDGHWHPDLVGQEWENFLGTRHDHRQQTAEARGNAVFADAHVEFISRQFSRERRHWDPWE